MSGGRAMRVGVLTGGGDCPGLNAVIRAVVRVGISRFGQTHVGLLPGWLALHSGLAGNADMILIPEVPTTVEEVVAAIESRSARGREFAIVVVSEGFELALGEEAAGERELDEFGHTQLAKIGVGQRLA